MSPLPYRVGRSSAGLGLFATTTFTRGDFIIEYTGERITTEEANRRGGKYLFSLNKNFVIDGSARTNTARYLNHSCKPNCYAELSANERRVRIYAKRAIEPGEELTYHYGKEYFEIEIAPMGCRCLACQSTTPLPTELPSLP